MSESVIVPFAIPRADVLFAHSENIK